MSIIPVSSISSAPVGDTEPVSKISSAPVPIKTRILTLISVALAIGALYAAAIYSTPVVTLVKRLDTTVTAALHLYNNTYLSWRHDHLALKLSELSRSSSILETGFPSLIVLYLGTALLLRKINPKTKLQSALMPWITAVLPVLMIGGLVGNDAITFGAIAWIPLLALAMHRLITSGPISPVNWGLLALATMENNLSSNQIAPISAFVAIWLSRILTRGGSKHDRKLAATASLLVLLSALFHTVTAPEPFVPKYPKSSHVLTYENNYKRPLPLIGETYKVETIDRLAASKAMRAPAIVLTILGLALWVSRRKETFARYAIRSGWTLAVFALLEAALPRVWADMAPVASLSRIVPWATSYSLNTIAVAVAAWLLGLVLMRPFNLPSLVALTIAAAAITTYSDRELYRPYLSNHPALSEPHLAELIHSPSAPIMRSLLMQGGDVTRQLNDIKLLNHLPTKDVLELGATIEITPSPAPELLAAAKNSEPSWRWSSRSGYQTGKEQLTIRFPKPIEALGLELDPGMYFTDYPRGLLILGGDCSAPESAQTIANHTPWQGALNLTPKGFPYYSPRNQVKVIFPRKETVECIFVKQTGTANFDWSINRVRVIRY